MDDKLSEQLSDLRRQIDILRQEEDSLRSEGIATGGAAEGMSYFIKAGDKEIERYRLERQIEQLRSGQYPISFR